MGRCAAQCAWQAMADAAEDAMLAAAMPQAPPIEAVAAASSRPRVARVAEAGTIGGSGPRVTVGLLRDLVRRRAFQPTAPDPCVAFREITSKWMTEVGIEITAEDQQQFDDPEEVLLGRGSFVWVALSGMEPLGCCVLLRTGEGAGDDAAQEEAVAPATWTLTKLGVEADSRRKGVGRRLFEALMRQFQEVAAEGQVLSAEVPVAVGDAAEAFLRSVGFEEASVGTEVRRFVHKQRATGANRANPAHS
mmetsp:Transcript_9818/g.25802  ORF Transcript_9818/g.25802 Transcript_9818/m.25802 type:complete len:248 (+) Transcript_9818:73-816(+)